MSTDIFFGPGPTQLHPRVGEFVTDALQARIPSISHRSTEYVRLHERTVVLVRELLQVPAEHAVFFLASGTEAMERIIENTVHQHSYHLVNGAFSERFWQLSQLRGRDAIAHNAPPGTGFSFESISVPSECELVCVTHNETSTGVMLPIAFIEAISARYPTKLLAVDIVSSAPYARLPWAKVDCGFFSVQKGFGLPAGLGVLIVHPRALDVSKKLTAAKQIQGGYHSFASLQSFATKNQTPETPNVLGIYLLGRVCEDLLHRGSQSWRVEIDMRAKHLYETLAALGRGQLFVADTSVRSPTVLTYSVEDAPLLRGTLAEQGIFVGEGYGPYSSKHIRIANFPQHTDAMVERLLAGLTAALR